MTKSLGGRVDLSHQDPMSVAEDEDGELLHGSQFLRLKHLVSGCVASAWQGLRLRCSVPEASLLFRLA